MPAAYGPAALDACAVPAERARTVGVDVTVARLPVVNHFIIYNNSLGDQAVRSITQRWLEGRGLMAAASSAARAAPVKRSP